ncbi:MAG: ABC transporter permease [Pseudomonadota bacterium]
MDKIRYSQPVLRQFGLVNGRGLWTLFCRGLRRCWRAGWYSISGPCISSILFLVVFVLASDPDQTMVQGVTVAQFVAAGVVVLSLSQSAFEAGGIWLMEDKMEGVIWDLFSAPLTPAEIFAGYLLPAVTFALLVGGVVTGLIALLVGLSITFPLICLLFAMLAALFFAQIGVLAGILAQRWESYSFFEFFLVLPLAFLSGGFFAAAALPVSLKPVLAINPVFYLMDGFRFGLTGFAQGPILAGFLGLVVLNGAMAWGIWRLLRSGFHIKA